MKESLITVHLVGSQEIFTNIPNPVMKMAVFPQVVPVPVPAPVVEAEAFPVAVAVAAAAAPGKFQSKHLNITILLQHIK